MKDSACFHCYAYDYCSWADLWCHDDGLEEDGAKRSLALEIEMAVIAHQYALKHDYDGCAY
jgi:hypothetical protein